MKNHNVKAVGYEYSPFLYILSQIKRLSHPKKKDIKFKFKSYFFEDLSEGDVIFCYILPTFMDKLKSKFEKELKSGTIIVSNTFQLKGWEPIKIIDTGNKSRPVYIYKKN